MSKRIESIGFTTSGGTSGTVKDTRSYLAFVPSLGVAFALQANALFDVRPAGEAILASILPR